ncbi:MAG: FAD-binding protein, partial [Solirubrobacteraceae bacterium]
MRAQRRFDAVVIGAGTAGLVAGTRLAQAGARVCVVARGIGSTHLAAGTIDVLGYVDGQRVDAPQAELAALVTARPDHPYALLGIDAIGEAVRWFAGIAASRPPTGYDYVGGLERNLALPTAVGSLRPSALVPVTMAGGDAAGLRQRVAIVGTRALRDFHPGLCAANLRAAEIDARSVGVELEFDRADVNAVGLARHFDDAAWRARFCGALTPALGAEDHVGLPAVLGLRDPRAALADLE